MDWTSLLGLGQQAQQIYQQPSTTKKKLPGYGRLLMGGLQGLGGGFGEGLNDRLGQVSQAANIINRLKGLRHPNIGTNQPGYPYLMN